MIRIVPMLALAIAIVSAAPASHGADLDRSAVDFTPPSAIKWVRNAASTNEQAILFGDPGKPGPYVVRISGFPAT